jgi:ribonuclease HI/exonuclease III
MNYTPTISILQYNVRKSKDIVMASLLRDPKTHEYDILAIQEPWRNPFMATTHHPAKDVFDLYCPGGTEDGPTRVCFFVNRRIDSSKIQFKEHTRDLCSITLMLEGEQQLSIYNVYNPPQHTAQQSVLPHVCALLDKHSEDELVLLGDFNLHHPLWGGPDVQTIEAEAVDLITMLEEYALYTTLAPGTITYRERQLHSSIDQCFVTVGLVERVIRSEVEEELDHDSDHLPISTILDVAAPSASTAPKKNWKKLDGEAYNKALEENLPPLRRPATKTALDRYTEEVITAIQKAIEKAVPQTRISSKSKEGWDEECRGALAEAKRLKRVHNQFNTEETWEAYRLARNHKARTIRKALRDKHREQVETAAESPEGLWKIAKWARTRETQSARTTPAIEHPETQREITEPRDKAELFKDVFFPAPPEANLDDVRDAEYRGQIELPPITEKEIEDAIRAASPLKGPGPDGITNKAIQAGKAQLMAHMLRIFNQSIKLSYCPAHFRRSLTAVLRKPGKDNYTKPKSYRPIALLNTIGKIMDAIISQRLNYLVETYQLLPPTHIGGRKKRSTEHALHAVTEKIYKAWNQRKTHVASLLLLDVSGAFDNVSHTRLLHNLRKRRIDEKTVRWIASFLDDRHTRIRIDGFTSTQYATSTGIPQGSPLSPILYLFYNADLIEMCKQEANVLPTGYIDDIAILAWAETTEETCDILAKTLQKAQQWANTHASVFAPDKFQLTHFTRTRKKIDMNHPVQTIWGEIKPRPNCKYLGLTMDAKLTWKPHIEEIRRKATKTVNALSNLGSSTWGASLIDLRRIYEGTALPQMMYACSIWTNENGKKHTYTKKALDVLQSIQARAARIICGAFRATSRAALDIEAFLLPIEQQIWKHNADTITRLLSCKHIADTAGLPPTDATTMTERKKHTSSWRRIYSEMKETLGQDLTRQEPIPPFITPPWQPGPKIHIDKNDETARERHDRETATGQDLSIYTDGSGIDNKIGAAAVCPHMEQTRSAYLGLSTTSTVYAAELYGISLALRIAEEYADRNGSRRNIAIYTDNQAAIWSVTKAEGRTGSYILEEIASQIQDLQDRGRPVRVRWIPAHVGIAGNEAADIAAKEATGWRADGRRAPTADEPQKLFPLKTTLRRKCKQQAETAWSVKWRKETKGRASFRNTPAPTKRVLKLHKGLKKRNSALLVQLRTEKIGLRDFLYSRNVPDIASSQCDCGAIRQTVAHVLLHCRTYNDLRNRIFGDRPGRYNLRTILNKPQLATKAIEFIEQTQILGQFRITDA